MATTTTIKEVRKMKGNKSKPFGYEFNYILHSDLMGQVMELYCPWYGAFTTNEADTKNKLAYWHAVRVMSIDELEAHLPERN
jgi:hypothetical protein